MRIIFDADFSKYLARALNILTKDVEVLHMEDLFGKKYSDEDWIPLIAKHNDVVITKDKNIHQKLRLREIYQNAGLRIFFFRDFKRKNSKFWDVVKFIINQWENIILIAKERKEPFSYFLRLDKNNIEEIQK